MKKIYNDKYYSLVSLPIIFIIILATIATLSYVLRSRQEAAELRSIGKMSQLKQALDNYINENGGAPPVCILDSEGNPMHSWRVLILPYFDENDFYKEYNMRLPWNHEHNLALCNKYPHIARRFQSNEYSANSQAANFLALKDGNGLWLAFSKKARDDYSILSSVAVVTHATSGIHWTEPSDMSVAGSGPTDMIPSNGPILFRDGTIGVVKEKKITISFR